MKTGHCYTEEFLYRKRSLLLAYEKQDWSPSLINQ